MEENCLIVHMSGFAKYGLSAFAPVQSKIIESTKHGVGNMALIVVLLRSMNYYSPLEHLARV